MKMKLMIAISPFVWRIVFLSTGKFYDFFDFECIVFHAFLLINFEPPFAIIDANLAQPLELV